MDCSEASSGPDPNPDSDPDPATWDCDLFMTVGARLSPEDGAGSGAVPVHMASAVAIARGRVCVRGSCVVPGAHLMAEAHQMPHLNQCMAVLKCTAPAIHSAARRASTYSCRSGMGGAWSHRMPKVSLAIVGVDKAGMECTGTG